MKRIILLLLFDMVCAQKIVYIYPLLYIACNNIICEWMIFSVEVNS